MERLAGEDFLHRCGFFVGVEVEVEDLLPHGGQVDKMALLAGVFLGDFDFHGLAGLAEAGEEGRDGLAGLEVDGAFLGLDDDVGKELAVEGVEGVVGGAGAVGFGVAPIEVVVVDEGAVEDYAVVGRERRGEEVGGVGGGAAVAGGAGLALGVGFDGEAGEIWDQGIDFVDFGGPPGADGGVEGVVSGEAADALGTGDGYAHGETDAPGTHGVGDAGELAEVVGIEELRGGVDVVDVEAVDADGGEEAGIFGDRRKVLTDVAAFEEYGAAGVTALDGAVGVVPLIDPADRHGGVAAPGVLMTEFTRVGRSGSAEKGKRTVKSAALIAARNDEQVVLATTVVAIAAWS